jgi:hypothetical protein
VDPRDVLMGLGGFFLLLWAVYGLLAVLARSRSTENRSDSAPR